jgi:hemoglobin-like flavoprotein
MGFDKAFDESYERVLKIKKNDKAFFDSFYEKFIRSSPVVKEHFKNTDMPHQKQMLKKSFYNLLVFYASNHADDYLEKTARVHSKHKHNISPELYDLWLENLINTVEEYDPKFNEEIELAWRLVLSAGITYMKFKYDK